MVVGKSSFNLKKAGRVLGVLIELSIQQRDELISNFCISKEFADLPPIHSTEDQETVHQNDRRFLARILSDVDPVSITLYNTLYEIHS
jgi:hypothetical protein